jgi:hypothetical protein
MPTPDASRSGYYVTDKKGNVLHAGQDHIHARAAFQREWTAEEIRQYPAGVLVGFRGTGAREPNFDADAPIPYAIAEGK